MSKKLARLSKRDLLQLVAIIRQAELSADSALASDWSETCEFFSGRRHRRMAASCQQSRTFLGTQNSKTDSAGFWGVSIAKLALAIIFRGKPFIYFSTSQLARIMDTLEAAAALFDELDRPDDQRIIDIRMKLHDARFLLTPALLGTRGLENAMAPIHLAAAQRVPQYSFESIKGLIEPTRFDNFQIV